MGACQFQTTATGRNAKEAYRAAVEDARAEYGNDPYSGTIATTHGFREVPADRMKGLGQKARALIFSLLTEYDARELGRLLAGDKPVDEWRKLPKLSAAARRALVRLSHLASDEKGACLALELPRDPRLPRGHRRYVFAGWASS